ncbi:MAG: DUF2254 domain-containing protein [Phycisphaerae bacterium]|nr:DUF2254 domain-containing protein [Phycisphaerae bacterium]
MLPLSWIRRYRIRTYLANATWVMPVSALVIALALVRTTVRIDEIFQWRSSFDAASVQAMLVALASALLTFIVFVCSSLLVAVQLASAQLTPRIIGLVFRDFGTRFSLAVFCFTFAYCLGLAVRLVDWVPFVSVQIAAFSCIFSVAIFFYLIDHLGRSLRPVGALARVARIGEQVISQVYPRRLSDAWTAQTPERDSAAVQQELDRLVDRASAVVVTGSRDGTIMAFDTKGLVALAVRHDCVIELANQAGDFVSCDEALFRIYGAKTPPAIEELRGMIAIGRERTYEQDPSYAFRIIVDMASKALSPAINDPTTAVLAMDQIHRLLRSVGVRRLDEGVTRDATGRIRFVYWTRDWADFVSLAVTEIRHFGSDSIQVMRRLRALLDDLIAALPTARTELLRKELASLSRSLDRKFADPEDRALADEGDLQGVGGNRAPRRSGGAGAPAVPADRTAAPQEQGIRAGQPAESQ